MPVNKISKLLWWKDIRYAGRRYRGSTKENNKAAVRAFEANLRLA